MQRYDYSGFSLKKLNDARFSHIKLLMFWPVFGLLFTALERIERPEFHDIYCRLDDFIPFCEWFVIPYYFWFIFLIGIQIYGFFYDVPTFEKYMKFTMLTYGFCLATYIVYPNAQQLRPVDFARNNIFTDIVKLMYGFDTNTNVCPSMHVTGSFAVYFAARQSKLFSGKKMRIAFFLIAIIICSSTVFLKQHSIIDVFAGIIVSYAAYPLVFRKTPIEQPSKIEEKQYA